MFNKLDAVNHVLAGMGEQPVSSLDSGLPDAEAALKVLENVSLDVQADGWSCNSDYNFSLAVDTNGNIQLPANTLQVDTVGPDARIDVVDVNGRLYNRSDKTFIFARPVTVDIVYHRDFDELPYRLRRYIACRAARVYQEQSNGSVSLDSFLVKEEAEAKAKWLESEALVDDANILRDSDSVRRVVDRNAPNLR